MAALEEAVVLDELESHPAVETQWAASEDTLILLEIQIAEAAESLANADQETPSVGKLAHQPQSLPAVARDFVVEIGHFAVETGGSADETGD